MRLVTLGLLVLLLLVHLELWFGRGSVPHTSALRGELKVQKASNDKARERNQRLAAEVVDLKEGLEMVEERARAELGMVKPDEVLVHVPSRKP